MKISEQEFVDLGVEEPHRKGLLTSPLGRAIDEMTFETLFMCAATVIALSTIYYLLATPAGHGLVYSNGKKADSFIDAAYFSVVTFTTLGYGDITPEGFGKLVAAVVVFSGLVTVALIIGKIASERQYAILILLHTSDNQRRLKLFCDELETATKRVTIAIDQNNLASLKENTAQLASLLQAIFNFTVFHLNQARLIEFGNQSSLRALLRRMEEAQSAYINALQCDTIDETTGNRSLTMVKRLAAFEGLLARFRLRTKAKHGISERSETYRQPPGPMTASARSTIEWSRTTQSAWLLDRIKKRLLQIPLQEWPKYEHKRIAAEVGISNTLAQSCIRTLIKQGVIS